MKSGTQKLKKILAFVMTAVMVLTAVPFGGLTFSAIAEDGEYTEGYYTYTVENGEATITDCDISISGEVVLPDTLGGYPVTSIGSWAFENCTGLTSVTIGNSVTSIGKSAFYYCSGLKNITYKGTVKEWKNISKGSNWNYEVPTDCVIHCTDGDIKISD